MPLKPCLLLIEFLLLTVFCSDALAIYFESTNYYWQNYLFDAQVYGKNIIATENTLSHNIKNVTLFANVFSYNNIEYNEVDLGLGTTVSLSKTNVDTGFWFYNYFTRGNNYIEPYFSVDYDWIVKPKITIGYIGYNGNFRGTFTLEYIFEPIKNLSLTLKPQIGKANYDHSYQYIGAIMAADYKINAVLSVFSLFEVDKTIEKMSKTVNSFSAGLSFCF